MCLLMQKGWRAFRPNDPKTLSDVTQRDSLYTTGLSCKVLLNVVTVKNFHCAIYHIVVLATGKFQSQTVCRCKAAPFK